MIKANIVAIDKKQLSRAVYEYHKQEARNPLYIVMSEETKKALIVSLTPQLIVLDEINEFNEYAEYMGNPIAICNKLEFGEVEII